MEKTLNIQKWEIYYQSWIPFDQETNEYFQEMKDIYTKREIKRRNKKSSNKPKAKNNGATQINKQWREYLAK